mgnify:CR=1 FL=1
MREYVTNALVLSLTPTGEQDGRVALFSEHLGRVSAKATSIRKISSKLAGHVQPLNFVTVRLVETGGLQVADAISTGRLPVAALPALRLLAVVAPEWNADPRLWAFVHSAAVSVRSILGAAGFDPAQAACVSCGKREPEYFSLADASFICAACLPPAHARDSFVGVD